MADPKVVKLAQSGYDVKTASDENLIYNSNWPLLKIFKQGTFTVKDTGSVTNKVIDHNLGYVPAFWWFSNLDFSDWGTLSGDVVQRSEYNGPSHGGFVPSMTENSLLAEINPGFLNKEFKFYYYIFALDLTKEYNAPIIKVGAQSSGGGGDKVFKLAKEGKDIESNNLEDYIIHSDARSPLVHAVYPGIAKPDSNSPLGYGFTFYHNLGYIPMVLAYNRDPQRLVGGVSNTWVLISPGSTGGGGADFIIDEKKIQYRGGNSDERVSLVVLKDPFNVDNTINVSV